MSKTNRWVPYDGEFKKLRGSKKQRMKKRRAKKANLLKEISFSTRNPNTGLKNYNEDDN